MYNIFFKILLSILVGFSFSLIITSIYIKSYIYKGPNSNEVKKKIYYKNNRCYKLIPKSIICPIGNIHD